MLLRRVLCCVGLAAAAVIGNAQPAAPDQETVLRATEPVEIPGTVLQPGTYILRLRAEPDSPRVARILNAVEVLDESRAVLATIYSFRNYGLRLTGQPLNFYDAAPGRPKALSAWVHASGYGDQFAYPPAQASEIAKTAVEAVFSIPVEMTEAPGRRASWLRLKVPAAIWAGIGGVLVFLVYRSYGRWRPKTADPSPDTPTQIQARKDAAAAYRDYRRSRKAGNRA